MKLSRQNRGFCLSGDPDACMMRIANYALDNADYGEMHATFRNADTHDGVPWQQR